ncbi:MAG TPA: tripartite tricarboxylate transporter substrate binding protein [Burkholderiales bacterium]|nr:tripartite tricarboxylate transporter substrate binding protein [Burkholderiales bacterium]
MQRWIIAAIVSLASVNGAWSQAYPDRPIRLVVPFPPGGNVDSFARVLARQVEAQLAQPIVIDNRGGANGIVGADLVAKAAPNGYTLLGTSIAFVVNAGMYKKLPYDSEKDFVPITNFAWGLGYLLTVNPSVPAQSVKELIALAKAGGEGLRYSTPGIGNGQHLAAELFATKAGIQLLHVPYKGGGPALNAILGGEVQITFPAVAVGAPHVKAGKLRALGFTGASRVASLPDVPTIAEAGVAGYRFDSGWHAWFAPARTPPAVINKLYTAIVAALKEPKLREYFIAGGYEPRGDTPEEFRRIFHSDIKLYAEIVRAAKIELQ